MAVVIDLIDLAERGVRLVGDPELMRMPADVTVATSEPASATHPPLEIEVAARALASVLVAAAARDLAPAEEDEGGPE